MSLVGLRNDQTWEGITYEDRNGQHAGRGPDPIPGEGRKLPDPEEHYVGNLGMYSCPDGICTPSRSGVLTRVEGRLVEQQEEETAEWPGWDVVKREMAQERQADIPEPVLSAQGKAFLSLPAQERAARIQAALNDGRIQIQAMEAANRKDAQLSQAARDSFFKRL